MFKILTGVLDVRTNPSDEDIEKITSFIFCRWLSGNASTVLAGNQINYYNKIPMVNQYRMIKTVFAGKIKYIPYPKNLKPEGIKQLYCLAEYFKINIDKAEEYTNIISKSELKMIDELYKDYVLFKDNDKYYLKLTKGN